MCLRSKALACVLAASVVYGQNLKFPPGFKFGAATSAYQVEGAWNVSDKSESIWDNFAHTKGKIRDGTNGDVSCDSYHHYKEDVQMAKDLGLQMYRFSISWVRLLPDGFTNIISEDGTRYYNNLIDELLRNNIEPVVTIYHWDMPQTLQELGGWTNPAMVDWYLDYVSVVYSLFADRVRTWITINEPFTICGGYFLGKHAPGIVEPEIGTYLCARHVLLAHARAWRLYDEEYKPIYDGKVTITNNLFWFGPHTERDRGAERLAVDFCNAFYNHPIYSKKGGWPVSVERILARNSKKQGFPRSRLPPFTKDEINLIKGTYDYFAVNHYTSRLVRWARPEENFIFPVNGSNEMRIAFEVDPKWQATDEDWFYIYPESLRLLLASIKKYYGDMEIIVTESGYGTYDGSLNDDNRVEYYKNALKQVMLSIYEDHVNVTGFIAWSLMDNFEWNSGISTTFGLYQVDFSDPQRSRKPRKSAKYYSSVIKSQTFHN